MSHDVLGEVLDGLPNPVLVIDGISHIQHANRAAAELFGPDLRDRALVTVIRRPSVLAAVDAVLAGESDRRVRAARSGRDGERVLRVQVSPIAGSGTGERGAVLSFEDITDIEAAEQIRREFVANVSHELKSPLTAVLGFIETLRGSARDDASAQARFLAAMQEQALRMDRLVSDLLSLSRVESDERVRPLTPVDLEVTLATACAALRPLAEEHGVLLSVDLPKCLPWVSGDGDQLLQVFVNLLENAIKYGGRDKTVSITGAALERDSSLRGPAVRIDVADEGPGIEPMHLPRLTERFYRIDDHRSRALGGTGLGLAIVKHIVNRHRGRLRIKSTLGKGSVFSVSLPR